MKSREKTTTTKKQCTEVRNIETTKQENKNQNKNSSCQLFVFTFFSLHLQSWTKSGPSPTPPWSVLLSLDQKCSGDPSTLFCWGEGKVSWVYGSLEWGILKWNIRDVFFLTFLSKIVVQIQCSSQYINQALLLISVFKILIYISCCPWSEVCMILAFPPHPAFAYLFISGQLLPNPDSSNSSYLEIFSISLEGSSYRKSSAVEKLKTFLQNTQGWVFNYHKILVHTKHR